MAPEGLHILPKDVIHFRGPYTLPSFEYLYLLNYTDRPIAFKMKTTAPLRFNVKPVMSVVPAGGGNVTIALLLHPLIGPDGGETKGGPFDRNKQKFMVEWAYVLEDYEQSNPVRILQKARERGEIVECRFRCKFDADPVTSSFGTYRPAKKKLTQMETTISVNSQLQLSPSKSTESFGRRVRHLSPNTSSDDATALPGKEVSNPSLRLNTAASDDDDEHPIRALLNHPLVVILIVNLLMVLIFLPFHLAA